MTVVAMNNIFSMKKTYLLISLLMLALMPMLSAQDNFDRSQILEVNDAVNNYRSSIGKNEMRLLKGLCEMAQVHAEDMASRRKRFSHDGFNDRVQQMKKRYELQAYSAAENLYYTSAGQNLDAQTLQAWIDSPGHHKNLIGEFKYSGIGVAQDRAGGFYVVQVYLSDE